MNLNKVFIIGRLTSDPQPRVTPSGERVVTLGVATNRVWNDKSGNRKESTEFHNVVLWGRQADIVSQFLIKGSIICVEGRLQTRSWEGKDGIKRRTTEIIGERIQLGPRPGGSSALPNKENFAKEAPKADSEMPVIDLDEENINPDDLPF